MSTLNELLKEREVLETGVDELNFRLAKSIDEAKALKTQRDELATALRGCLASMARYADHMGYPGVVGEAEITARAALAKVQGV